MTAHSSNPLIPVPSRVEGPSFVEGRNPELSWIAETNGEIDRERRRLGLKPRPELRSKPS